MSLNRRVCAAVVVAMVLAAEVGQADVPTSEEDCRYRNSAMCEDVAGVPFVVEGPCPSTSRTIRPPGHEDCSPAVVRARVEPTRAPPIAVPPDPAVARGQDLVWVGQTERWLLPALVGLGAVLSLVLIGLLIRWLGRNRNSGTALRGAARSTLHVVIAGAVASLLAYASATAAFRRIFNGYDNHDTAAPLLIAAPVAFGVLVVVWPVVFAATVWLLRRLSRSAGAPSQE